MADEPANARRAFGDVAPRLAEITDQAPFGDIWERAGLSPRDRSLVTVTTLVAGYRTNEPPFHIKKALENGVTQAELVEAITHIAFYVTNVERTKVRAQRGRAASRRVRAL